MRPIIQTFAAAALVATAVLPAQAQDTKAGDLVIMQPWSRATPGGAKVAGGYLKIENKGTAPDTLVGGTTEAATKVEVHEMAMTNGVMTMRELDNGLPIAAGAAVTLKPGGYHLMFTGLKRPFKEGEKVPVTLQFAKAGKVEVTFAVHGIGAMNTDGHGSMHKGGAAK